MGTYVVTGSDPNAAYRLGQQSGLYTGAGIYGDHSTSSTVIGPERLVARTDKDAAAGALGRSLPAVIGTGRVDGVYFIGGMTQVDTTTTTTTTSTQSSGGTIVSIANDANEAQLIAQQPNPYALQTSTSTSSSVTTASATRAGYVLAYDFFERGYELIRLEVDGRIVYDAENGITGDVEFRYYGGRQTRIDPIVDAIVGTLPGAYENMVMVFLDGFPSERPPSVSAVISNAVDEGAETVQIDWTGEEPVTIYGSTAGNNTAYDPGRGVIYQTLGYLELPSTTVNYLAVLDLATHIELYRVELQDTEAFADHVDRIYINSIRGTDYVIVHLADGAQPSLNRIYNVLSGEYIAEYAQTGDPSNAGDATAENFLWVCGLPFGPNKWLMFGSNFIAFPSGSNSVFGLFDHLAGEITIYPWDVTKPNGRVGTYGRVTDTTTSFFVVHTSGGVSDIYEVVFNGTGLSSNLIYTTAQGLRGIWFDPGTNYVVVSVSNSGSALLLYIDPDSGDLVDSVGTTVTFSNITSALQVGGERFFARPGYLLITPDQGTDPGKVMLLNVAEKTMRVFAESESVEINNVDFTTAIFDQGHFLYVAGFDTPGATSTMPNSQNYVIHYLPNAVPQLIDLEDAVTDIMSMPGFSSADLTFSGFGGLTTYGFVIAADTNIQNAVRTLSDIYDFYWCDTGSGFYFKKPGTDLGLTIDATLTTADLVNRDDPVMSNDDGDIRTPSSVEIEYVSKEGGYRARPTSFSMTTGVLNSITTPRLSTPILFNDLEAQRLVTEKFFQYQENRRNHSLIAAPEHAILLPGDVVSFPSDLVNYVAVVESVGIDLLAMGVEIGARDFAQEVTTTITAASNNPGTTVLLRYATLYIHLDIPLLSYGHDLAGDGLVQYGMLSRRLGTWTGGSLYRGAQPEPLALIFDQAFHNNIVALAMTVLGAPVDPFATDDASTVTIRLVAGNPALLVDATEDQVLDNDANLALIGKNGRWELVGFTTVTDDGNGDYTLSGFVRRGFHGSEVWADDHAIGDYFIYPLSAVKRIAHPITDLDDLFYYKAVGFGQDARSVATETHTIPGVAETPYAVRNITVTGTSPGGLVIAWDYRSRVAEGLNPDDHGEATLAFEVDIYDPGTSPPTSLRTLTTATNSVTYANADIVTDFGSYPASLTLRVYMMSELDIVVPGQTPVVPGRGYAASIVAGVNEKKLAAGFGSYLITGTDATLLSSGGSKTLAAAAGSIVITGSNATLAKSGTKVLAAAAGSLAITGAAASLLVRRKIAADAGSLAISGSAATLNRGKTLVGGVGSYAVTGTAATLVKTSPVTWNPSDKSSGISLSSGDLRATKGAPNATLQSVRATRGIVDTDNGYFEIKVIATAGGGSAFCLVGVGTASANLGSFVGNDTSGWGFYQQNGDKYTNNAPTAHGASWKVTNDVVMVAFKNGSVWFGVNGTFTGNPAANTGAAFTGITGTLYPMVSLYSATTPDTIDGKFKTADFTYTPPSGFTAWG